MFGLWGEGKTGVPKENPRGAEWRANRVVTHAARVEFQIRPSALFQRFSPSKSLILFKQIVFGITST